MRDDELIHPVPYAPRVLRPARAPRPRRRWPRPITLLALLVVGLLGTFLLAARAVQVRVEPEPQRLEVHGWPHIRAGSVRLLLPGHYRVVAERPGYRRLEAPLEVTGDPRQIARFVLERLPGLLDVRATPPAGVRVSIDGQERGTTPLRPFEVAAGEHEVRLRAEGYAPLETRVTLAGGGATQVLEVTLVPDRAPVTFDSDPRGATVRVDGREVGNTPLTVDLTSGDRRVDVSLEGFEPVSRRIVVVAERPMRVPTLGLRPMPGRLALTSDPPGATVSVDGRFRGETPFDLELSPEVPHAVRLTKAGHDAVEESVTLARGQRRELRLALAARTGDVEVVAEPSDAEVFVDGQSRGRAPQTLRLSAVPHVIEVRHDGFESHRVTVTPRPGFLESVRARLESGKGRTAPKPTVLRTPSGHELRLVGGGRFEMGASRREPGRRGNETQREVELKRPFYLATREVTNAQFHAFRPEHSSGRYGAYDLSADVDPVVQVTWEDAASYCNWLSGREGLPPAYAVQGARLVAAAPLTIGYRLPTEAEWSRAARYPDGGPLRFPWGDALPAPERAGNYADESARPVTPVVLHGYQDRYPAVAPVGSFPPNALGLHDLGGNVAEWAHDVYWIPSPGTPLQVDPTGPPIGELHVILGASFLQGSVSELRLSYRDYGTKPRPDVGFRIARYAE